MSICVKLFSVVLLVLSVTATLAVTAPTDKIPAVLTKNGLKTLSGLLGRAKLDATLSGAGPFTVFAPTDAAFSALPPPLLESLRKNVSQLATLLKYHVVPSKIGRAGLKNDLVKKTLSDGSTLRINVYGQVVTVNGATISKTVEASNGFVHIINRVLLPDKPAHNIMEKLGKATGFSTLLKALNVAGLTSELKTPGPFTLFAPNDDAFNALPAGALDKLLAKPKELKQVLLNHLSRKTYYLAGIPRSGTLTMASGKTFPVKKTDGGVTVGKARVMEADVNASNGVIHVISAVLLN